MKNKVDINGQIEPILKPILNQDLGFYTIQLLIGPRTYLRNQ